VAGLASSLGGGLLLQAIGWRLMHVVLIPWLLAAVTAVVWLASARRSAPLPQMTRLHD
jgi:hypothetical protein